MFWIIKKGKKFVEEIEDLKEFNLREFNYFLFVLDVDVEKVDFKYQDIDERRNFEDWMFDYVLQCIVIKFFLVRKRKVVLFVEVFEIVKFVMLCGREFVLVMSYGRYFQICN